MTGVQTCALPIYVARAKELGSKGILVASGIVKAKNWEKIIGEFSRALI